MTEYALLSERFTGDIIHARDANGNIINEITTVAGWTPYWLEEGDCLRPEMHVIDKSTPDYLAPAMRLNEDGRGLKAFKQWAIIDAGYYRQITVPAGVDLVTADLMGHCWYSQGDDATLSEWNNGGVMRPVTEGMSLLVGIDPTGGTDFLSADIGWAEAEIFDAHGHVYLGVIDPSPLITVFIGVANDFGFKHVDGYLASVDVVGYSPDIPEPEPAVGWTVGHEQYERTYVLMPPGCNEQWPMAAVSATWNDRRFTVGGSADDAGIGPEVRRVLAVNPDEWDDDAGEPGQLAAFFNAYYTGIEYVEIYADNPADLEDALADYIHGGVIPEPPEPPVEPPVEPPTTWTPRNYVPTGIKTGFHAAGDGGQTGDVFAPLTPIGAQPPTAKVIVSLGAARDIKAIDPSVATVGRMIDVPGYGNVEGFDYNGDPEAQALWHMSAIAQAFYGFRQYYDFIEVINEQAPPSPQAHVRLAEFFKHCMADANRVGAKLALFSHSTGTPEPEAWDAIADTGVFEMAAAGGHAISLHEYNINGGGGHLYRYRYLYENIILPRHLNIPLYITEYNVDVADAGNAPLMLANWKAYDAEVARDPYVAGVHIYSTGEVYSEYRPTIYSLWEQYRQYAISVKDRRNG